MDDLMTRAAHPVEAIAAAVRRRRSELGWTLDTAAVRTGVSRRLLAQLEAAEANPSLSTLLAVAAGLDLALADLLGDGPVRLVELHDRSEAPVLWNGPSGGCARLLAGCGALEVWEWRLAPGESYSSPAHRPGSREVITVVRGAVEVAAGSSAAVVVRAGQSATIHADHDHAYVQVGRGAAEFTLAVHEPVGARS